MERKHRISQMILKHQINQKIAKTLKEYVFLFFLEVKETLECEIA